MNYIWHSPLTPQNQKMDALGGDPRIEPLVDRNFSWGRINDQWLDRVGANQPRIRIGSPLIGHYREKAGHRLVADMPSPSERNVLVLQYTPIVTDIRGLNSNIYAHFIDTIRLLRERGYKNIRLKLHPGRGRWKKSYFETIASHFGLQCKILKSDPFVECLKWADLVIGPAQTGAFFETLAAGKPYYPVLLEPHGLDSSYYLDYYPIFDSIEAAVEALDEAPPPDGQALLDAVWGTDTIKNSPLEFLKALEGSPTNAGPPGNQAL